VAILSRAPPDNGIKPIRPVFRALDFQADKNSHSLLEAANFLKNIFNKGIPNHKGSLIRISTKRNSEEIQGNHHRLKRQNKAVSL
jgi:hypothetical protein